MTAITRAQARRAVQWADFLARHRFKRGKKVPGCVTCGAPPSHELAKGEPAYDCGPHEPFRISVETLERARRELGG